MYANWTLRFGAIALVAVMLGGCAFGRVARGKAVWQEAETAINSGMPVEKLLACAGRPIRDVAQGDTRILTYGVSTRVPNGSTWCVLEISAKGGRTVGVERSSANPGGMTDGSQSCGLILDNCVGDGKLRSEVVSSNVSVEYMTSESDIPAAIATGRAVQASADAAARNAAGSTLERGQIHAGSPPPKTRTIQDKNWCITASAEREADGDLFWKFYNGCPTAVSLSWCDRAPKCRGQMTTTVKPNATYRSRVLDKKNATSPKYLACPIESVGAQTANDPWYCSPP